MALPANPNLVIFITDQQRQLQYFPSAWTDANLTNLNALTANGLTFANAIVNSARCSPSRGVLTTGLYAPTNGLVQVGASLPTQWPTLTARLQAAGLDYQIGYVGKWHMSSSLLAAANQRPNKPATVAQQNAYLLDSYGTPGWDAPDAGTALGWQSSEPPPHGQPYNSTANTLGGGPNSYTRNDARIADDAIAFLQQLDPTKPFLLVVSLVNPHDVWVDMYSGLLQQAYPEFPAAFDALAGADQFTLPASYAGDDLSTKPAIQTQIRDSYTQTWAQNNGVSPVPTQLDSADALSYLKFYAYLTWLADAELQRVYTALQALPQFDDTLVVRLADHGEMGMSHGGSMEKDCNVYAETLSVPYIFSNPVLFPQAQTCDAQAGLIDIVPTLFGLLGQPLAAGQVQGVDLSTLILDPSSSPPRDSSLFTYDDGYAWHIRAIQAAPGAVSVGGQPTTSSYKYAVYYQLTGYNQVDTSTLQYELYVPGADGEIVNLQPANPALQTALHALLTQRMSDADAGAPAGGAPVTPPGWPATVPAGAQ
jgi:choline-sulfatase